MLLRPQQPIPSVPDDTARVTRTVFRRGNPCLLLRDRLGVMFGLMKICSKLKISFYRYFGDRLHVPGVVTIPPLPDLIRFYCRLLSVCNKSLTSFRSAKHKISLAFEYKANKVSPATRLCYVAGRFLPKLGGIFECRHFFAYDTYLQDKSNATLVWDHSFRLLQ